ncbi:oxidoreductase [Brachybacterium sp. P6-10-X1]|uniref:SDR family oxidoreductase n=1 Tax=Brachybacterium sp. P6-10-X1 TaxID=1903186 RepID=UPI00097195BA|nr:SDR family NAD(P)-dependent oxidoreductase [Brachybacterium sp. P6-10-X1]APX32214.1 oxidoreductase [Brachybacterium sp. P6-10-X1]
MNITGHTIFIPGATSGIGLALALALQQKGNQVIVGGRRTELLERVAAEHPGIVTVRVDTSDPASIQAASSRVLAEHPDLDVLIAMAGIMRAEDWTDPADFLPTAEEIVTTNLLGPIRLIAAFMEHLLAQESATIMTVSSGLAFVPLRVTPTYNATKAAIHLLSESLRLQLAGTGVDILELVPPAVRTDLMPGQATSATAMPLAEFVDEVIEILENTPEAAEIQVQRVSVLRHAEARGDYPQVVAALNGSELHHR